jgi:FkbH-like protein
MMRQLFLDSLRSLVEGPPHIVVIHSSLANLAPREPSNRWDFLYGIDRLIADGWTVALPAFTFSFCSGRPYHHSESASEVGIFADWLLADYPGSVRTPHPIYSFVVAGSNADKIRACPSATTFGDDSPFGLFERENATLVMLGCDWKFATQFHRYEEKAAVPYRYFKEFTGCADLGDGRGEREVSASMYVRNLTADPINDFSPAVTLLRSQGSIRTATLSRATVESVRTADLARVCAESLGSDPMAFVANRADVAYKLAKISQTAQQPALRVAVLGSANVQVLRSALERDLKSYLPDRLVEIREVDYGQLRQSLLDPSSDLRRWQPHISIFCDRIEDLLGQGRLDGASDELTQELVSQYAELIASYHTANGGWTVVHRFAVMYHVARNGAGQTPWVLVNEMNSLLDRRLTQLSQLLWVDVAAEASGNVAAVDFRLWHIGRIPYSEPFSRVMARRWSGLILAILGKTARAVVVDLDNTLWGGVLGEDGLAGVQLGGDFPGNAYLALQRVLKSIIPRGIALTVCSKNDEDLALRAIDQLPAMQIRSNDLVAHRINWRPKWENIREIAAELNLGVESLLFIDDNPAEREAAQRNLPGLKVLDLPEDPALYAEALSSSPWLEMVGVTTEDRARVQSYKARREVEQQRTQAASLEDFWESLQMKLHLQPLNDGNIARASQLCMKTNQFNTTTRRYDQRDLRKMVEEGDDVVVVGLEDRYSELENIGLIILRADGSNVRQGIVDSYLLSCRILGRGIETAVLHWALQRAVARDWNSVRGLIIETERNTPARGVFREAGFQSGTAPGEWMARTETAPGLPPWLTVIDGTAARVGGLSATR